MTSAEQELLEALRNAPTDQLQSLLGRVDEIVEAAQEATESVREVDSVVGPAVEKAFAGLDDIEGLAKELDLSPEEVAAALAELPDLVDEIVKAAMEEVAAD